MIGEQVLHHPLAPVETLAQLTGCLFPQFIRCATDRFRRLAARRSVGLRLLERPTDGLLSTGEFRDGVVESLLAFLVAVRCALSGRTLLRRLSLAALERLLKLLELPLQPLLLPAAGERILTKALLPGDGFLAICQRLELLPFFAFRLDLAASGRALRRLIAVPLLVHLQVHDFRQGTTGGAAHVCRAHGDVHVIHGCLSSQQMLKRLLRWRHCRLQFLTLQLLGCRNHVFRGTGELPGKSVDLFIEHQSARSCPFDEGGDLICQGALQQGEHLGLVFVTGFSFAARAPVDEVPRRRDDFPLPLDELVRAAALAALTGHAL